MAGDVIGCLFAKLEEQLIRESSPEAKAKAERGYLSKKKIEMYRDLVKEADEFAEAGTSAHVKAAKDILDIMESRLISQQTAVNKQLQVTSKALKNVRAMIDSGLSHREALASLSFNSPISKIYGKREMLPVESAVGGWKTTLVASIGDAIERLKPEHFYNKADDTINANTWDDYFRAIQGKERLADKETQAFIDRVIKITNEVVPNALRERGVDLPKIKSAYLAGVAADGSKMRQSTADEFADFMLKLDIDWDTVEKIIGKKLIGTVGQKRVFLKQFHLTETTGGLNKLSDFNPIGMKGKQSLVNGHNGHRLLSFRSAESKIAFDKRFGSNNFMSHLAGYAERSARELGALDVYGPRPTVFRNTILREISQDPSFPKDQSLASSMDRDMRFYLGSGEPMSQALQSLMDSFSGVVRASFLGSHVIGALVSDVLQFAPRARTINGLVKYKKTYRLVDQVLNLNPADKRLRKLEEDVLQDTGWFVGKLLDVINAEQNTAEQTFSRIPKILSNGVEIMSGNQALTNFGRRSNALSALVGISKFGEVGRALDEPSRRILDFQYGGSDNVRIGNLEMSLKGSGLSVEDVMKIRKEHFRTVDMGNGRTMDVIDLQDAFLSGDSEMTRIATSLTGWMDEYIHAGSPISNPRIASLLKDVRDHGGAIGKLVGTMGMFQGWFSDMGRQVLKTSINHPTKWRAGALTAGTMAWLTLGGVLQQQLYNLKSGKDLAPLDEASLWYNGLVRSGAGGIAASLFDQQSKGLFDPFTAMLTPGIETVNVVKQNVKRTAQGKETKWGSDMYQAARQFLPGRNMWWSTLALGHILDGVLEGIDPGKAMHKYRSAAKKSRETNTGYWWKPNEALPDRAPDVTNLFN